MILKVCLKYKKVRTVGDHKISRQFALLEWSERI